ncbi:MAG: hypothetical protein ACJAXZ_003881, partial [Akkermansiaceae bacterium]
MEVVHGISLDHDAGFDLGVLSQATVDE